MESLSEEVLCKRPRPEQARFSLAKTTLFAGVPISSKARSPKLPKANFGP